MVAKKVILGFRKVLDQVSDLSWVEWIKGVYCNQFYLSAFRRRIIVNSIKLTRASIHGRIYGVQVRGQYNQHFSSKLEAKQNRLCDIEALKERSERRGLLCRINGSIQPLTDLVFTLVLLHGHRTITQSEALFHINANIDQTV